MEKGDPDMLSHLKTSLEFADVKMTDLALLLLSITSLEPKEILANLTRRSC
jgi:hypothetical protein